MKLFKTQFFSVLPDRDSHLLLLPLQRASMHKCFPWPLVRRRWDMALRFLLLPLLRSWHSLLGELESIESNRESEEKTGTPLGSCRPINIIHKGNIFPPQGPQLQRRGKRHTRRYEVPAICPLLKLFKMMNLYFCRSSC